MIGYDVAVCDNVLFLSFVFVSLKGFTTFLKHCNQRRYSLNPSFHSYSLFADETFVYFLF